MDVIEAIKKRRSIRNFEIDQKKLWLMTDEEAYFQFLRDVTRRIARQLKVRAGIHRSSSLLDLG